MHLFFFEDEACSNFHPLTLTRPVDDLRTGILTMSEKWHYAFNEASWTRSIRPELTDIFSCSMPSDPSKPCLWINSRYLPTDPLQEKIKNLNEGTCIKTDDTLIAANVDSETSSRWMKAGKPDFSTLLDLESSDFPCITHLWDLFLMNGDEIRADIKRLVNLLSNDITVSGQAILQNKGQIFIEDGAHIEPGAILMADKGPIYVGTNATVKAGSIVEGPAAVCEKAVVKPGAKIHANTTIGPVCKVGGEVADSIFHSYSNKAHDGYLGSSLIGQWCNLGAGTNNSNLKNNYSTVRFTDWNTKKQQKTDQQFLGTVMGDHSKTAINTRLNTGTVCGVSCNIFSADFPPKYIPSFSWVGSNVIQPYKIDKALETMKKMMARRDVELTDGYEMLMRTIFENEHAG